MLTILLDTRLHDSTKVLAAYLYTKPVIRSEKDLYEKLNMDPKTLRKARRELKANGYSI